MKQSTAEIFKPQTTHQNSSEQTVLKPKLKRFTSDQFFMYFCIFIGIFEANIFMQFPKVFKMLENYDIRQDFYEFLWLIPGYFFSYLLYFPLGNYLQKFWENKLTTKGARDDESKEQRLARCRSYLMASFYYVISFAVIFLVAKEDGILPFVYGGTLDLSAEQKLWPKRSSVSVRILYLFSYGHHLERLLNHIYAPHNPSTFYTMLLHHIITVGLIAISFHTELCSFGIAVLMLLDLSDFLLQFARFLRETVFTITSRVTFVFMLIFWIHGRIIGLGWEVLPAVFEMFLSRHIFVLQFNTLHIFYISGLCLLWILNIFWFSQIVKIFVTLFVNKKTKLEYEDSHCENNKSN